MSSTQVCRRDQIINPSTNRCVFRSGKIGRQVIADKAKVPTKGDITVRVGEVYTGSFMKNFVELHLSAAFFKIVTKRPKILRNKEGNAYVFGPLFRRRPAYQFMGHHYNDGAQTGIVRMDTNVNLQNITNEATWDRVIHMTVKWEDPRVLRMVRRELSKNVVFLGETDGGDGGADVYIHRNRLTGEIDSIIIDNEYFFEMINT